MAYTLYSGDILTKQYQKMIESDEPYSGNLDLNYRKLKNYLEDKFYSLKSAGKKLYELDLLFGLDLYEYFINDPEFNQALESNYDFWKYIAIFVIPEIIGDRHNFNASEYFYEKGVRIYPNALYWYIHMSWQGDIKSTYEILKNNTTDEIMNIVERPSRIGINLNLNREIMKFYSLIPKDKRFLIRNGKRISLFRVILIKNTSKLTIYRPEIYPTGIEGYVKMLFSEYVPQERSNP